jgi:hypothetical protein
MPEAVQKGDRDITRFEPLLAVSTRPASCGLSCVDAVPAGLPTTNDSPAMHELHTGSDSRIRLVCHNSLAMSSYSVLHDST